MKRAQQGEATVLGVVGEAGIGKSRLAREAVEQARHDGVQVLLGRAVDAARPFRPLVEAVAGALRETGSPDDPALLPLRPVLAHLVPGWGRPSPGVSVEGIAEGMLRLLGTLGCEHGAVLVIEDLHLADDETLQVVEYLADNRVAHGAACLLTARPDPAHPADRLLQSLADRRAAELMVLQPLDGSAIDRMVLAMLDEPAAPRELLEFMRAHSDGVPFLVEELLAGLVRIGALTPVAGGWQVVAHRLEATVPRTLADSISQRFDGLRTETQQVLAAAAILGHEVAWDLLVSVTQLDEEVVLAGLREATYASLLSQDDDHLHFRHALTREHILRILLPPERRALARRALPVVAAMGDDDGAGPDLAAELAQLAGEPLTAAAHLLAGARAARSAGAPTAAVARLELARDLAADDSELATDIDVLLADALALAGRVDDAVAAAARAHERMGSMSGREDDLIDLELSIGRAMLAAGRTEQARHRIERARVQAAERADAGRTAAAEVLAAERAVGAGAIDEARDLARGVLSAAPSPEVVCEAWEVLGRCERVRDLRVAEEAFETARRTAAEHHLPAWEARALQELGTIDLLDTLRLDRLTQARNAAVRAGVPVTEAVAAFHLASALVACDEPAQGREVAEQAAALAGRLHLAIEPFCWVVVARAHVFEGQTELAEEAIERALASGDDGPAVGASVQSHVRAMHALFGADREGGLAALDEAVRLLRQTPGQHDPHWGLWALLRTLVGRDAAAARAEAAAALGSDTRFNRAALSAAVAVAAGAAEESGDAETAMDESLSLVGGMAGEWTRHLIVWLVAPAALRDGWGSPVTWLQEAILSLSSHGHGALASDCRRLLRDAGAPVPRRGRGDATVPPPLRRLGITSRETDVLLLIVEGLTYREIAEHLVLSPRTIEKHVGSLLRKAGVADRHALADLADELGIADD